MSWQPCGTDMETITTIYAVVLSPNQGEHNDPERAFSTRADAEAYCAKIHAEDAKKRIKNRRHYDIIEIPLHSNSARSVEMCWTCHGTGQVYDPRTGMQRMIGCPDCLPRPYFQNPN